MNRNLVFSLGLLVVLAGPVIGMESSIPPRGSAGVITQFTESDYWVGGVIHVTDHAMLRPSVLLYLIQDGNNLVSVRSDYLFLKSVRSLPGVFSYWGPGLRLYYWESTEWREIYDADGYWIDYEEIEANNWSATAYLMFGTQVMIHPALGVFADLRAAARLYYTSFDGSLLLSTHTYSFSVGGVLYFREGNP